MPKQTDPDFLAHEAYREAKDLATRICIQERYRTHPQRWYEWLFQQLRLPEEALLLELGCGPGDLWRENRERLPAGWRGVLSDLSTGMLTEARGRLPHLAARFAYAAMDAQALPFRDGQFEAVIGNGLIDHVPDRVRALDEIRRVLRPGGRFFTSTGGRTHLQEIEALARPFLPKADFGGDPHRFGLENGATLLAPWFSQVTLERYDDELVFERAEPVLAYILSEAAVRAELSGEKREAFEQFVRNELAVNGQIRVTTAKGAFEAVRG